MPIYERRCWFCDKVSLKLCKIADREQPVACPECGSSTKLIMSATQTTFTYADQSPFKGTKKYRGRKAKYIQDQHGLLPDGD